jgi:uncharacterized protein
VKLSPTIKDEDVIHLKWLKNELGDDLIDSIVITTGAYAYRYVVAPGGLRRRNIRV